MSRFHPSWPSPLLALDPIRLRPMGWLDDLLPMRPPSLWRDRSLYARALRWQPDMADLSWLFDAYAMLGIEMPPPRIEHRTHQRSPQRGRLKGSVRQTQLRRRRAPIKGGKRPLAIPRWSSPPQMIAPIKGETKARVETSPSFRARRTVPMGDVQPSLMRKSSSSERVQPNNLAKVQWRSPERSAPSPALSRSSTAPVVPSMGVQPTLLRKEDSQQSTAPERTVSQPARTQPQSKNIVADVVAKSKRPVQVLSPRKPKVEPFPALDSVPVRQQRKDLDRTVEQTPPPKVTWQRRHTRSPWRLNQSGRTLFKPKVHPKSGWEGNLSEAQVQAQSARSVEQSSSSSVQRSLAERITRIGQQRKGVVSPSLQVPLRGVQAVGSNNDGINWSPVRKGVIRDAILEQGKVRSIAPAVQMELPPSPTKESISEPSKQKHTGAQNSTSFVETDQKRTSVRHHVDNRSVISRTPSVRVPTRVPWRLKPSSAQKSIKSNRSTGPEASSTAVVKRSSTPIAQQIEPVRTRSRTRIPEVRSWYLPQRQQLIEHFQNRRPDRPSVDREGLVSRVRRRSDEPSSLSQRKQSIESVANSPKIRPIYSFASPLQSDRTLLSMSSSADNTQAVRKQTQTVSELDKDAVSSTLKKEPVPSAQRRTIKPTLAIASGGTVFRAQEQTMVAPLRAGTLVFPTPSVVEERAARATVRAVQTAAVDKSTVQPTTSSSSKTSNATPIGESSTRSMSSGKYPKSFVQERNTYQRQSTKTTSVFWTMSKRISSRKGVGSVLLRAIQERSVDDRWRLPKVMVSDDPSTVKPSLKRSQGVRTTSAASKSVFRAPTTFWQGSFSQRGSIQLPSPMVYTTRSEDSSGTQSPKRGIASQPEAKTTRRSIQPSAKQAVDWIPKQVLQVNERVRSKSKQIQSTQAVAKPRRSSVSRQSPPVRSVSWTRKPSFPDPFAAQRQYAQSASAVPSSSRKQPSEPVGPVPTSSAAIVQSNVSNQTKTPLRTRMDDVSAFAEQERTSVIGKPVTGDSGVRTGLGASKPLPTAVRRVIAPTISASLVYRSPSVEIDSKTRAASKGKYASAGPSSDKGSGIQPAVSTVQGQKSRGRYAPNRGETPNQANVNADAEQGQNTAFKRTGASSALREQLDEFSNTVGVAQTEAAVEKAVQRLVRRLPNTQQSLLRSKIALPTNWARKLGLAPTDAVKMGWKLQRSLTGDSTVNSARATPPQFSPTATTQLVIPSEEGLVQPKEVARANRKLTSEASTKSEQRTAGTVATPTKSRRLSNAQVSRIIERQVSFFRAAQRQSFLKASQMTEDPVPGSKPTRARGGLQQVTGEMRKALQRMVFASDAQPVFLDAISDIDTPIERSGSRSSASSQVSASVSSASKSRSNTRRRRLGMRSPQWRPGIHTPAPKYGRRGQPSVQSQSAVLAQQAPNQTSVSAQAKQTVMPQSAPMTMLQSEEQPGQSIPATKRSNAVDTSTETPVQARTVSSKAQQMRAKPVRGRSATVAPRSLMGRSDVGVFLQPKRKAIEPEVSIPKPSPQTVDSVDSEADVFMIDPSGNLLTGKQATKRLKELGFARSETKKPTSKPQMDPSGGSYTWEAPADLMQEAVKQVRQQMDVEEKIKETSRQQTRPVRQSVIKEWTEEQLLTILVELASSSPEANALLRDVQERVEEYFDLERFRKI